MNGAQMWLSQDCFVHYFCFQKGQVRILQNVLVGPVAKVHTQYRLEYCLLFHRGTRNLPVNSYEYHVVAEQSFPGKVHG